jgi:hypothetical protein
VSMETTPFRGAAFRRAELDGSPAVLLARDENALCDQPSEAVWQEMLWYNGYGASDCVGPDADAPQAVWSLRLTRELRAMSLESRR